MLNESHIAQIRSRLQNINALVQVISAISDIAGKPQEMQEMEMIA